MVDEKHYYNRIYAPRLAPLMHDKDAEIERLQMLVHNVEAISGDQKEELEALNAFVAAFDEWAQTEYVALKVAEARAALGE